MPSEISYRTCPLCEATCGLAIEHEDGRVKKVRGDADDVFSKGFICPKGAALGELNEDPDRLRRPMKRIGDRWEEIDWDEAFETIETKIGEITAKHDRQSLAIYLGNPSSHNLSGTLYNRALIKSLGTRNIFSASTVDQMPKHLSSGLMFGSPLTIAVPDIDRTDFMLLLGANPWVSNGSLATAPDWPGRIRALRKRGGKLVVVDPVRTQTADHADVHLAIRPGADAWFLAAIAHTIFEEGLSRPGRLTDAIDGLPDVEAKLARFSPDRVAPACGVEANTIRQVARDFAAAERAVCYGRIGVCTQRFGSLSNWLVDVINAITGNLDEPGGAMFPLPAHEPRRPDAQAGGRGFSVGRWSSRVRNAPEVLGEFPVSTLAEEITADGEPRIRALFTVAGNPVLSTPNGDALSKALEHLDFMVSIDPYLNETTRHADIVLPPPPPLSRPHYDVSFYGFAIRNVANFSPPVMPLPDGAMAEWQIMLRLVSVLSGTGASVEMADDFVCQQMIAREVRNPDSPLHGRSPDELMDALGERRGPERMIDFMLRAGVYGDGFGAHPDGLRLDTLIDQPHGIDFGPLVPRLPSALKTKSGKIELAATQLINDLDRLESALSSPETPELVLIGRRHLRSNNSWMHNVPGLMTGRPRCTALIHPNDAAKAGIRDGQSVRVRSATGEVVAVAEVDASIRPGVISLPHGWGHDDGQTKLSVAAKSPGVNTNLLVSNEHTDPLSGNSVLTGVPVSVASA